jgi:hypothetical protein
MEQQNIRKVFTPRRGFLFIRSDYSQLEVRLVAHCSGDQLLIDALNSGDDIHARVAKEIFDLPCEVKQVAKLYKSKRAAAKAIVFGLNYGITSVGLAKKLRVSQIEAQEYINAFFDKYKTLKAFMDTCDSLIIKNKFIQTMLGRRRHFQWANARALRQGKNYPIQATAAEVVSNAMVNVHSRIKHRHDDMRLLMQIHDELLLEAKIDLVPEAIKIVKETMEIGLDNFGFKFKVPMVVDPDVDYAWGFSLREAEREEHERLWAMRDAFDSNSQLKAEKACRDYYTMYFRELRKFKAGTGRIVSLPNNVIDVVQDVFVPNCTETGAQFRQSEYEYLLDLYENDSDYINYRAKYPLEVV